MRDTPKVQNLEGPRARLTNFASTGTRAIIEREGGNFCRFFGTPEERERGKRIKRRIEVFFLLKNPAPNRINAVKDYSTLAIRWGRIAFTRVEEEGGKKGGEGNRFVRGRKRPQTRFSVRRFHGHRQQSVAGVMDRKKKEREVGKQNAVEQE